ncbi:MAG: hypothetical protein ABI051_06025 [Vicinamibacterales bacterium]
MRWLIASSLILGCLSRRQGVLCQSAADAQTRSDVPDGAVAAQPGGALLTDATLGRIRQALASNSGLVINDDSLRFYLQVTGRYQTFEEYLRGANLHVGTPPAPPPQTPGGGGSGIDLLQLIRQGVKSLRDAQREHELRLIRNRIEEELLALEGMK